MPLVGPMQVPMTVMDNSDPALVRELVGAIEELAGTGAFIGGPAVDSFERAFAGYAEAQHAIGVASGTEALTLAVRALGLEPGDEVIVPANSFIATAEAVVLAGGLPQFADVDPETQLITPQTAERAYGPNVRGVIPVHLFGRTASIEELAEQAGSHGAWLLEDCAQAHGARYDGRRVGTFGAAGTFSFYPAKNLGAWGDAGAVVTNDAELAEKIRLLRSHGEQPRYHHRAIGTTGRLDAIQAVVLERKLGQLEQLNERRRQVADALRAAIGPLDTLQLPPAAAPPTDCVYHQFVVRTPARDRLREHLSQRGIASGIHYPIPIHRSDAFASLNGHRDVAPVATKLATEICSLPIFPGMTAAQVEAIADAIQSF
ncbi:MAG TPA: DegT/DnrJ/EryC1/StrS family aminotransferase [Solirubrobacteraceae bacterium]|nr:DegT/DnrJ/EryC1/StrS family aminotransferase [Solirubrobacteraceae bacterium]